MRVKDNKIVRTICSFSREIESKIMDELVLKKKILEEEGFTVQTLRICSGESSLKDICKLKIDDSIFLSAGTIDREIAGRELDFFLESGNVSFNIDLSDRISMNDINILFRIIESRPEKTFNFAYTFNNVHSSPFFPSSTYQRGGFTIGMQPTNLARECSSLDEWFVKMRNSWIELVGIFPEDEFIGIDSSVAPLYSDDGSLVNFIKKLKVSFPEAVTSDIFLKISRFIVENNPRPAGLCGIMFPCLEDFELADEYERGNFSIERNIFISLHSGLGIDTYPIAKGESPERVLEILQLLRGLSNKYKKPLAARFVSDGKSAAGERSCFNNKYLKDVILKKL